MRRIICIFVVALLAISFVPACFAEDNYQSEITPQYVSADNIITSFNISTSGLATMKGSLRPKDKNDVDKVEILFVIKNKQGDVVYNRKHVASYNSVNRMYTVEKNVSLTTKGQHTLQTRYYTYKNNALIESIRGTEIIKSY